MKTAYKVTVTPPALLKSKKWGRRTRGAVMVEYAVLLMGVGMPAAAGIVAGGTKMLREYHAARDMLLLPIP